MFSHGGKQYLYLRKRKHSIPKISVAPWYSTYIYIYETPEYRKILVSFSLSLLCISLIVTLAISHSFLFFQVPQRREPQAISPTLQLSSFSVLSRRTECLWETIWKSKDKQYSFTCNSVQRWLLYLDTVPSSLLIDSPN